MTLPVIVSGGQTGVDRAALDVSMDLGLGCRGWCPKGRKAEDGPLPQRYTLRETESSEYSLRTRYNVRDSDATLILNRGELAGGTAATLRFAEEMNRPCLVLQMDLDPEIGEVLTWIAQGQFRVLNVAGPRESKYPGIYVESVAFLTELMQSLMVGESL